MSDIEFTRRVTELLNQFGGITTENLQTLNTIISAFSEPLQALPKSPHDDLEEHCVPF